MDLACVVALNRAMSEAFSCGESVDLDLSAVTFAIHASRRLLEDGSAISDATESLFYFPMTSICRDCSHYYALAYMSGSGPGQRGSVLPPRNPRTLENLDEPAGGGGRQSPFALAGR